MFRTIYHLLAKNGGHDINRCRTNMYKIDYVYYFFDLNMQ